MNKTIIINISGSIFHIEEDAYETLKGYINSLKKHFSASEDSFEIISDIENRIAELFSALLKEGKQVLLAEDVADIIRQMGNPADFQASEEEAQTIPHSIAEEENSGPKRFYRNPEDRVIGGVCGGIASYLDVDPIIVRLLWLIAFFFAGFGLMIYIILWIVIPKAKSRAEKLAMKGQKATVSSIHRSIQDEVEDTRKSWGEQGLGGKISGFIRGIIDLIASIFSAAGGVFLKIFGLFILVVGFFGSIGLLVSAVACLGWGMVSFNSISGFSSFMLLDPETQALFVISAFVTGIIPFILFILLGVKLISNYNSTNKSTVFSLLGIWAISLIFSAYFGIQTAHQFSQGGSLSMSDSLNLPKNKVLYLSMNEISDADSAINRRIITAKEHFHADVSISGDHDHYSWKDVSLSVKVAEDGRARLEKTFSARGSNVAEALNSAEKMHYGYQLKDSLLSLNTYFDIPEKALFRAQSLHLTLHLPEGSTVYLGEGVENTLMNAWDFENRDPEKEMRSLHIEKGKVYVN